MTPMEKLTERLNTALREHGYTVFERELSYAEGGQRQMDCWRWEGVARQANLPSTINVSNIKIQCTIYIYITMNS